MFVELILVVEGLVAVLTLEGLVEMSGKDVGFEIPEKCSRILVNCVFLYSMHVVGTIVIVLHIFNVYSMA